MRNSKVVMFERGAEFYFDLGYKYIQKGKLKTAKRYMEKAAALKPDDSFIQFNYGGLLAELGDVELSTEILLRIVDELDPEYAECYFGLGCNFLQLQKIQRAAEYLGKYLDKDPDGEFAEDAEDLLEMLMMIKDANNDLEDEELEKIYKLEEEAIEELEKREYKKAAEKFESVVTLLPNAVPARNNLSLAYYYLGRIDKAIELAREVLTYEEGNVHANCNLSIYYNKLDLQNWVEKQLKAIKKINVDNEEYLYKIADTFGCLGKHEEAYKFYKKLLKVNSTNPLYIHYAAVAAFNTERYSDSIELWEMMKVIDPNNLLSDYYIDKTMREQENYSGTKLPYMYQLPKEEISDIIDRLHKFISMPKDECSKLLRQDRRMGEILFYGICFDRNLIRKLIFNKIKSDELIEAEAILKRFLLVDTVENHIKVETVFLLNMIGIKEPYSVNFDGEVRNVAISPEGFPDSEWKSEWESVKDRTVSMMKSNGKGPYKNIVEDIWYGFIKAAYPNIPRISNVDAWAAALEYTYCRFYCTETTQQQLAEKYGVSKNSVGEKFRTIYEAIGKTYKNNDKKL